MENYGNYGMLEFKILNSADIERAGRLQYLLHLPAGRGHLLSAPGLGNPEHLFSINEIMAVGKQRHKSLEWQANVLRGLPAKFDKHCCGGGEDQTLPLLFVSRWTTYIFCSLQHFWAGYIFWEPQRCTLPDVPNATA